MPDMQSPAQPAKPSLHWLSLLQLILSLLAAFILIGAAVVVVATTSLNYFSYSAATADLIQPFMVAASLAFAGFLVLPSAWYAWRHIASPGREPAQYPDHRGFGLVLTIIVVVLVGSALLLGNLIAPNDQLAWWLLPPLNIVANGLPALWVVYIGTRGLIPGAPRRLWGVFATGLVLGPLVILILELALLVPIGILALAWITLNPGLANQFYDLIQRIQNIGPNLDVIIRGLVPLLVNPGIILLLFAYLSVLVPLLEEALKPIGVWFLSGQRITPAQGFGYGILSGAGFALFENLGNTSNGSMDWALVVSTRISTLVLHCFTAGLVGWALASAWSERRYFRLLGLYFVAAIVHGLWNGLALLSALASLQGFPDISLPSFIQQIGPYASFGIIMLGVIVLILYLSSNSILRRRALAANHPSPLESQLPMTPESKSMVTHPEVPLIASSDPETSTTSQGAQPPQIDHDNSSQISNEKNTDSKGTIK
jgi:hypothetical protein